VRQLFIAQHRSQHGHGVLGRHPGKLAAGVGLLLARCAGFQHGQQFGLVGQRYGGGTGQQGEGQCEFHNAV